MNFRFFFLLLFVLFLSCTEKPVSVNFASNTNLLQLAGVPSQITNIPNYSITISGDNIYRFRYKLGLVNAVDCTTESGYSESKAIAEPVLGSTPTNGSYKICAIGQSIKNDEWHSFTNASSGTWEFDGALPTLSGLVSDGDGTWSNTSSPTLTWSTAIDNDSGLSHFELAIGTTSGGTEIQDWTNIGNITSYQQSGLILTRGQNYYPSLRAVDKAGNRSAAILGDGWHVRNEMWTTNGPVYAMVEHNNKLYIGGSFTHIGEWVGDSVPLDKTTGQISWPNPLHKIRASGGVNIAIPDGEGGYIIGGNFTAVGGLPRNKLARILADGSVSSWNPEVDLAVVSMVLNGTTLYIGGSFTKINGTTRNRLASIDMTTGALTAWDPNLNSTVMTLVQSGTKLYVGGIFTSVNGGTGRNYLASFSLSDGSLTSWNPDMSSYVVSLIQAGSALYAGGYFTTVNGGTSRNYLASFNLSDGSLTTWNPNSSGIISSLETDGVKLYVGGSFSTISGSTRNNLASYNLSDGSLTTWNPNISGGGLGILKSDGTTLYVGGIFTAAGGSSRNNLASYNLSDGSLTTWNPNISGGAVYSFLSIGTRVLVGGRLSIANSMTSRNHLAAFDLITGQLLSFDPNMNGDVNTLTVRDNKLFVGGAFTTVNGGTTRNRLASYDLTNNTLTSWNPSITGGLQTVKIVDSNSSNLFVGGQFTTVNGTARRNLASFNLSDGSLTTWNPDPNTDVYALAVGTSTLYVGGYFTSMNAGANLRNRLASFALSDGSLTTWNPNSNDRVFSMVLNDDILYVGGHFTTMNGGTPRNRLASFDTTTGSLTTWSPSSSNTVFSMKLYQNHLYIGGNFTQGSSISTLANYNLTDDIMTFIPSVNQVNAIHIYDDTLFLGSLLDNICSNGPSYLCPLNPDTGNWLPGH